MRGGWCIPCVVSLAIHDFVWQMQGLLVVDPGYLKGGEGLTDLTERYRNNPRQSHLSDSFVPFLNFKLKRPQRGGWLATQSTLPGSAPGFIKVLKKILQPGKIVCVFQFNITSL